MTEEEKNLKLLNMFGFEDEATHEFYFEKCVGKGENALHGEELEMQLDLYRQNIDCDNKMDVQEKINQLVKNMEEMAYNDCHINAGVNRKVVSKLWEKDDKKRTYITINCYSLAGKFKGSYKCGYVDMVSGEYVCGMYDDVNAETSEYLV